MTTIAKSTRLAPAAIPIPNAQAREPEPAVRPRSAPITIQRPNQPENDEFIRDTILPHYDPRPRLTIEQMGQHLDAKKPFDQKIADFLDPLIERTLISLPESSLPILQELEDNESPLNQILAKIHQSLSKLLGDKLRASRQVSTILTTIGIFWDQTTFIKDLLTKVSTLSEYPFILKPLLTAITNHGDAQELTATLIKIYTELHHILPDLDLYIFMRILKHYNQGAEGVNKKYILSTIRDRLTKFYRLPAPEQQKELEHLKKYHTDYYDLKDRATTADQQQLSEILQEYQKTIKKFIHNLIGKTNYAKFKPARTPKAQYI